MRIIPGKIQLDATTAAREKLFCDCQNEMWLARLVMVKKPQKKSLLYIIAIRAVVSGGIGIQPNCLRHAFRDSDGSEM